jgi:hypothetical protein
MLLQRIDEQLTGISYRLDRQHWSALYLAFQKYLTTPRDVTKFCNHFRGPMTLLSSEVDAADILALEALRLFDRPVWAELPNLIKELTGARSHADPFSQRPDHSRDRLNEVVNAAILPDTAREVLRELFPAAGQHLGGSNYGPSFQSEWRRQLRFAHPAVLQIYLSKQVQPTAVSTELVERALDRLSDADALRRELLALDATQLADLLTRLEDYEGTFPDDVAAAIPVLYQLISRLPARDGMWSIEPDMRVTRVVLRMFRNRNPAIVSEIVRQAIEQLPSLSDRWSLVRLVGHLESSGHRMVSESDAEAFESELVTMILTASAEQLADERDLSFLITLATDREPTETRAKLVRDVEHDGFLIALLLAYRGEVLSETGRHLQLRWDHLADLLGEPLLIRRVTELPELPEGVAADTLEMLTQARRYATNPGLATDELAEYRQRYA